MDKCAMEFSWSDFPCGLIPKEKCGVAVNQRMSWSTEIMNNLQLIDELQGKKIVGYFRAD